MKEKRGKRKENYFKFPEWNGNRNILRDACKAYMESGKNIGAQGCESLAGTMRSEAGIWYSTSGRGSRLLKWSDKAERSGSDDRS